MQGVPNPIPDPVGVKFPEIPQLSMAPQFGPGSGSGEQFPMMQAPSPPLEVQQEEVVGVKLGGIKSGHIQAIPIPVCQDPGLQNGITDSPPFKWSRQISRPASRCLVDGCSYCYSFGLGSPLQFVHLYSALSSILGRKQPPVQP